MRNQRPCERLCARRSGELLEEPVQKSPGRFASVGVCQPAGTRGVLPTCFYTRNNPLNGSAQGYLGIVWGERLPNFQARFRHWSAPPSWLRVGRERKRVMGAGRLSSPACPVSEALWLGVEVGKFIDKFIDIRISLWQGKTKRRRRNGFRC